MNELTALFSERKNKLKFLQKNRSETRNAPRDNNGAVKTCPGCGTAQKKSAIGLCECGYHYTLSAPARLRLVLDTPTEPIFTNLCSSDPLGFPDYAGRLEELREKTGLPDAFLVCEGNIKTNPCVVVALDTRFLMGSMGGAVGDAIAAAAEHAHNRRLPLIIFSASGGARMQEGMISLMQMAKTSGAIRRLSDSGGLFISVLTHPTTGGVTASFAMLGDVILAEPGALIGFAGPRVIEQTIRQSLPAGFQRAEFQAEHGFCDAVVPRGELRETLGQILKLHNKTN